MAATEGAKVAIGRYPLLMLSHGNNGTPMALHDLANRQQWFDARQAQGYPIQSLYGVGYKLEL